MMLILTNWLKERDNNKRVLLEKKNDLLNYNDKAKASNVRMLAGGTERA